MKLKLITLTALTALSLGGVALAQDQDTNGPQRRGGRGRHDMMENMTQSLNLTPDQKTKIQPILDEAKPKMEAIHRDAMEKSRALMEDTKAKIRPMLTPEQQKTLDDMKNNRRGHKGRHGGGNGGNGGDDEGDNG